MCNKFLCSIILPIILMVNQGVQAATVFVDPSNSNVSLGASFILQVKGSGFGSVLDGGAFDLAFNPSVLSVTSVAVDTSIWEFVPINGAINNATGKVSDSEFNSFIHNNIGNFNVASVTFQAIGMGSSIIGITGNANNPYASGGVEVSPTFTNATVNVVPVPPAFWLFASALFGMRTLRTKEIDTRQG